MRLSRKRAFLISVSALALGVVISSSAIADTFTANKSQTTTAGGGTSSATSVANYNTLDMNAFQNAVGVINPLQNTGANSALSNGNTVDAVIADGGTSGNLTFYVNSGQSANQTGGSDVHELGVLDDNTLTDQSFQNAAGVISVLQNNGSESAINNGNAVAAVIVDGTDALATNNEFDVEHQQTATVGPGFFSQNIYDADVTSNTNTIDADAFGNAEGVMSAAQNNGPNSAINNGNAVAAVIDPDGDVQGDRDFSVSASQDATVNPNNSSHEEDSTDSNTISEGAFSYARGVGSILQNNGANSALNNGNSVSAIVTSYGADNGGTTLLVGSSQTAMVESSNNPGPYSGPNLDSQDHSDDTNLISGGVLGNGQGVFSALQNNGANSAMSNGNAVAAIIGETDVGNDVADFDAGSGASQDATVFANSGPGKARNESIETDSDDLNDITDGAFAAFSGVASVAQNNGANSAIINGKRSRRLSHPTDKPTPGRRIPIWPTPAWTQPF